MDFFFSSYLRRRNVITIYEEVDNILKVKSKFLHATLLRSLIEINLNSFLILLIKFLLEISMRFENPTYGKICHNVPRDPRNTAQKFIYVFLRLAEPQPSLAHKMNFYFKALNIQFNTKTKHKTSEKTAVQSRAIVELVSMMDFLNKIAL